uniref:Uncharacterized protein n=1 Tax=Homalodisca liturata TaxID=320908 RepID=A0A1B6I2G1_9HEMI
MYFAKSLWYCICLTYTLAWSKDNLEETQSHVTSLKPLKHANVQVGHKNKKQEEIDKHSAEFTIFGHNNKHDQYVDNTVKYNRKDESGLNISARKQSEICREPNCSPSDTNGYSNSETLNPPCGGLCILKKGNVILKGMLRGLKQHKHNMPVLE